MSSGQPQLQPQPQRQPVQQQTLGPPHGSWSRSDGDGGGDPPPGGTQGESGAPTQTAADAWRDALKTLSRQALLFPLGALDLAWLPSDEGEAE